jgi:aminopeptidase N
MKKIYLLFFSLFCFAAFAQDPVLDTQNIAESEMKSASSLLSVETNPDTQNYDITYHKLEFTVDPAVYFINGIVTTTYTPLEDMNTVTFDLTQALTVSSVTIADTAVDFVQNENDELVITLPSTQLAGTSNTVVITYSGEPAILQQGFTTELHQGSPVLYTLSEPFGARDWWPCKQDLNDKVDSIDVYITAPSQYVSVSNGLEIDEVVNGDNKTTHFHHGHPIPAYLIAIAVSNYSVFNLDAGTAPNTFQIVNYVYPEDLEEAQTGIGDTPSIIDIYEQLFETYPFSDEKYGHCEFGYGGGMEHTTVSFIGGFSRNVIAHELGHQWFGDKVTCGSWKDIWLNEGFATYLSGLTVEHLDGIPQFITWKQNMINFITSQSGGAVYLTDEEATNVSRIFSSRLSYDKGGMVLEMLRWKLGDDTFFLGLKNYLDDPAHAYGYAVTDDLKNVLETTSGVDLDEFFTDWVYNQGYPTYTISAQNISEGMVKFTVNQTQSDPSVSYFEMPVPVRVFGADGQQTDFVLDNTANGETFEMAAPFVVTSVQFDPDFHIISRDNSANLGMPSTQLLAGAGIYPNPVNDKLQLAVPTRIELQKTEVRNALGQLELESNAQTTINVSGLSSGVHFLTMFSEEGNRTFKFLKE